MIAHRPNQRWQPEDRLRRSADFVRCYRRGMRRHGACLSVYAHVNEGPSLRLGMTASRKVGNAVVRHRLKRWARETVRRHPNRSRWPAVDVVVHFKPNARRARFEDIHREIDRLMQRALRALA